MATEKSERLYRLLENARREVEQTPEWRRSDETNRELQRIEEERQRQRPQPQAPPDRTGGR